MRAALLCSAALYAVILAMAGCGDDDSDSSGSASVDVVATTTQVADFVRNVGGDRVAVHQILPPNADPHGYEPRPSDAKAVVDSQAIFRSGGDADEWMDGIIDNAGSDAPQITLIDNVRTREGGPEHEHEEGEHAEEEREHADDVDPHWWLDPRNVELAVPVIRDELIKLDPDGRATYKRNAARYLTELNNLDEQTAACIEKLPPSERALVTSHDALGYYADRYGLEIIGAVIPSLSTQAQPSAKDIEELVDEVREHDVKAIFPESSLSPKLEDAIARESGAATGGALWADTLGPEGSSGATYIDSIAANTETIVKGLSGGATECTAPPANGT
jgi:ABC-type Zn uptake system ZnuABC Zn-binding protein ZnuA